VDCDVQVLRVLVDLDLKTLYLDGYFTDFSGCLALEDLRSEASNDV
jgi:hypothetical protein